MGRHVCIVPVRVGIPLLPEKIQKHPSAATIVQDPVGFLYSLPSEHPELIPATDPRNKTQLMWIDTMGRVIGVIVVEIRILCAMKRPAATAAPHSKGIFFK